MKMPLKVLVVEDSEDDTRLLKYALERGGFDPTVEQVCTRDAMDAALRRQSWDLVVSDHSMPGFGSIDALGLLKQRQPDIPFIVVSGAVQEEFAVTMIREGASDCVSKNELPRLIPAIQRELRETAIRRAQSHELEAHSADAYLAAIVASSQDAIIGLLPDGTIQSWNAGAATMYGYSAREMKGRSVSILVPTFRPNDLPGLLAKVKACGHEERCETVRVKRDGKTLDVSLTLSPIKDQSGEFLGVSSVERDITARKREEQERLKLIEELTDALARVKTLNGLLAICSSCKKIRDDRGNWQKLETFISEHTQAKFTHGICPECVRRLYPDYPLKQQ